MKNSIKLIMAWAVTMMTSAGFWGIVFPQYTFTSDCVQVINEKEQNAAEEEILLTDADNENLYVAIASAESEKVHIKCSIWEWIGEKTR